MTTSFRQITGGPVGAGRSQTGPDAPAPSASAILYLAGGLLAAICGAVGGGSIGLGVGGIVMGYGLAGAIAILLLAARTCVLTRPD